MSAASACVGPDCCPLSSHPQWGQQMLEMSSFICCPIDICVCPQLAVVTKCLAGSILREECFSHSWWEAGRQEQLMAVIARKQGSLLKSRQIRKGTGWEIRLQCSPPPVLLSLQLGTTYQRLYYQQWTKCSNT